MNNLNKFNRMSMVDKAVLSCGALLICILIWYVTIGVILPPRVGVVAHELVEQQEGVVFIVTTE